jgi:phosphoribosylanthranilate isomerase
MGVTMRLPNAVTLTGIDDGIDLEDLWAIVRSCPAGLALEFGILFNGDTEGRPRYPSARRIGAFVSQIQKLREQQPGTAVSLALHLCREAVIDDFLSDREPSFGLVRGGAFRRVQLNLRADRHDVLAIRRSVGNIRSVKVVTQHNRVNAALVGALWDYPNHEVLFDASGGRGTVPDYWQTPIPGKRCGYAGGLSPDNLEDELMRLSTVIGTRNDWWIDMETGLRDEGDRFDPERAIRVLATIGRLGSR